jgi:hypothetical protein
MKITKSHCIFSVVIAMLMTNVISAIAATALQSGVTVALPTMPASSFVSNLYLDVDSSAAQLTVNVAGSSGDLDLFLRYGSPFPEQNSAVTFPMVSEDLLGRYAHYHSISAGSNESIVVLRSSRIPVHAGRWYISIINSDSNNGANGTVTVTAANTVPLGTIHLDFGNPDSNCDDSFWTDATPAASVGGNNATTLGLQRQNALFHASTELVQQLQIPVDITVHACGERLGGDANSAILAHAAPLTYLFDDPQFPIAALPKKYTWYAGSAAVRLAGTSNCGLGGGACSGVNNEEIEATFNEDIGSPNVIGGEKFYLGFDPSPNPNHSLDFVTIAMHEMTHGLGFFGLVNLDASQGPIGAKAGISINGSNQPSIAFQNLSLGPYDDIYDDAIAIVNSSNTGYTPFMGYEVNGTNDAARALALTSGPITLDGSYNPGTQTNLRWSDPVAVNASGVNANFGLPAPDNFPSLYAPCDETDTTTCSPQPSSTLSHTIQPGDMMNAYYSNFNLRNMGLAVPMLAPVGWSNAAASMPVFGQPIPSNWFDRRHSGHGFDFQLFAHDPVNGQDVYFLTFYTYQSDGTPEWYQAVGSIVDGVFVPSLQSNGNTLYRLIYTSTAAGHITFVPDSVPGTVIVDFNQAALAPACRNADRSDASQMAIMSWRIGNDSDQWCMEPIVPLALHANPDFNGHWFAASDSGWGFELLDVAGSGGAAPTVVIYVYYPGPNGQPAWATASGTLNNGAATMQLLQVSNGYCRLCAPPTQGLTATSIGTFSLNLTAAASAGVKPTGSATIVANYPGGGAFSRSDDAITMLSLPTGQ